eukprot:391615_1
MGTCFSKNKKKKYNHNNCECSLFKKHEHCCKYECFQNKQLQKKQLLKSLVIYNANYIVIVDIIMDYLPSIDLIEMDQVFNYYAYFHSDIIHKYNNKMPPCYIYLNNNKKKKKLNNDFIIIKIALFGPFSVGKSVLCK